MIYNRKKIDRGSRDVYHANDIRTDFSRRPYAPVADAVIRGLAESLIFLGHLRRMWTSHNSTSITTQLLGNAAASDACECREMIILTNWRLEKKWPIKATLYHLNRNGPVWFLHMHITNEK